MALVGLSVIIITLSYVCYNRLPSSWSLLTWFQRRGFLRSCSKDSVVPTSHPEEKSENKTSTKDEHKADLDRQAMPPPPPPQPQALPAVRDPFTSETPKVVPTNTASMFGTLALESTSSNPSSSFPALNSIQRASGDRSRRNHIPSLQPPLHSPFLVPPVSRSSLPNRSPATGSSPYLSLPPTHSAIPNKPSKRVLLSPGHSPLDWAYISSRPDANLRGIPVATPYLRVTPSLLRQYTGRKGKDAWTILGGKVYNITPYLPYHPGGEPELMKAAGRDGTKLFGEVHPWVNWEGMLEPCLIGIIVAEDEVRTSSILEDMD